MALNTEAKRWSMLQLAGGSWPTPLINPSGSDLDSEVERLTYLNIYGGLTVSDTTAPILSSATGTATGTTTASGTVDTDEGNGTLYFYASTNASESAATIKASGDSQAVSASGTQNVTVSGLTAETSYYLHYVQDDAATNTSNVLSSSSFTTDAEAVTEEQPTGGWWYTYDHELALRKRKKKEIQEREAKAEQIQDDIDRELAKELRKQEREQERIAELRRLAKLAQEHKEELQQSVSQKAIFAAEQAMIKGTYSALERLERELAKSKEEEEFLIQATSMILNS
jgi:hypothetical protein